MAKPEHVPSEVLPLIIARAEAACERYRSDVELKGIDTRAKIGRRQRLAMMEATLARLKEQQDSPGNAVPRKREGRPNAPNRCGKQYQTAG